MREPARVTPGALAFLERVAHGSAAAAATAAEAAAAAAAAAAFAVREPALVASGAFAFLEGVAHRAGRRAFAEPRLLRVLALRAPRGLIFPALGLVELLFPRRERELGVAVAAAQSDVFVLLGKRVRIRRGLGVHLEAILLVLRVFAGSFLCCSGGGYLVREGFLWKRRTWRFACYGERKSIRITTIAKSPASVLFRRRRDCVDLRSSFALGFARGFEPGGFCFVTATRTSSTLVFLVSGSSSAESSASRFLSFFSCCDDERGEIGG